MAVQTHELDRKIETPLSRSRARHTDAASLRAAIAQSWNIRDRAFPLHQSDTLSFDDSAPIEPECFSAATLLDVCNEALDARTRVAMRDSLLDDLARGGDLVHFFRSSDRLPPDSDCTAVAGLALAKLGVLASARGRVIAERMLAHRTAEGLLSVYFDEGGERAERVDAVVTCNVLRFAGAFGVLDHRPEDVEQIRSGLGAGTRYYTSPDVLLLAAARLARERLDLRRALGADIARALRARLETSGTSLERSCRAAAALHLGIETARAIELALTLMDDALDLRPEPFFQLGRRAVYLGSTALTAGFRLHALGMLGAIGGGHD